MRPENLHNSVNWANYYSVFTLLTSVVLSTKCRIKSDKPLKAVERDSVQPFPLRFDAWQINAKTGLTQHLF